MVRRSRSSCSALVCALGLLSAGCMERTLAPVQPCLIAHESESLDVQAIDKIDLLFVVDNSISMAEEQASLRSQFPRMIELLTTGTRADGTRFRPVRDLHLGVVSTDLGTAVAGPVKGCEPPGDDGRLLVTPNPSGDPLLSCGAGVPSAHGASFLSFQAGADDPLQLANDFQCIATLGTTGCGFEQQLESMLRALSPSGTGSLATGDDVLSGDGTGSPAVLDPSSRGFLRPASPSSESSLVAVIVVTDEEDCSSRNPAHFEPGDGTDLNLRCYQNKQNLFEIQRYVDGLRALRPDDPSQVLFAAITGVPEELVDAEARAAVDWDDPQAIDAFYKGILDADAMQEVVDRQTEPTKPNLRPSCQRQTAAGLQEAYPPRRIVELAAALGKSALVQSICTDDFRPAMDALIDVIADAVGNVCLLRPLVPNAEGLVAGCDVVWELPVASTGASTLAQCSERAFLSTPTRGARLSEGRTRCVVAQVPARGGAALATEAGWYYDDASPELIEQCGEGGQRIAFTEQPPSGVTVRLECAVERGSTGVVLLDARTDTPQPSAGDACADADGFATDMACAVHLQSGALDTHMFCHPFANVCVMGCETTADCPLGLACDDRPDTLSRSGRPHCVNPTCGGGS